MIYIQERKRILKPGLKHPNIERQKYPPTVLFPCLPACPYNYSRKRHKAEKQEMQERKSVFVCVFHNSGTGA
jgi:hypothetical protein